MSPPRRHRPGRGTPRHVRKIEHVEVSYDKDGVTGVEVVKPPKKGAGEFGEPCYTCACCLVWAESLELLRAHIDAHTKRVPALLPCSGECLVCQSAQWTGGNNP